MPPRPTRWRTLILPLLLLGVFFFVFAPQMKRNKQHQKLLTELKSGDEVVTTGGIFGTIAQVKPDRFIIEIAKGVRVEINRANVEARAPGEDPDRPPTTNKPDPAPSMKSSIYWKIAFSVLFSRGPFGTCGRGRTRRSTNIWPSARRPIRWSCKC